MYYLPTTFLFLYCSFMIYSVFLIDLYYRLTFGVVNLFFFSFLTTIQSPYLQNSLRFIHFPLWNSVSEYYLFSFMMFLYFCSNNIHKNLHHHGISLRHYHTNCIYYPYNYTLPKRKLSL